MKDSTLVALGLYYPDLCEEVRKEMVRTGENNDSPTLADFIADIARRFTTLANEPFEGDPQATPDRLVATIERDTVEVRLGPMLDAEWAEFVEDSQGRLDNNVDELFEMFLADWQEKGDPHG